MAAFESFIESIQPLIWRYQRQKELNQLKGKSDPIEVTSANWNDEDEYSTDIWKKRKIEHANMSEFTADTEEMNKRIKAFIETKRSEVNTSNKVEFLENKDGEGLVSCTRLHLYQKNVHVKFETFLDTCARVAARELNRTIQMKLAVANNEEGPLERSSTQLKSSANVSNGLKTDTTVNKQTPHIHQERLKTLESALRVKFAPSAKLSVHQKLQYLESKLIQVERDFPVWAAVHLHQPKVAGAIDDSLPAIWTQVAPSSGKVTMSETPVLMKDSEALKMDSFDSHALKGAAVGPPKRLLSLRPGEPELDAINRRIGELSDTLKSKSTSSTSKS
ncbi:hypothetical protein HDV05_001332 [Chytridiales sp. JEL 0842]|nr:hypothetical protein HDV05_001332 [Chytridiales sp. JEL 0842]